MLLFLAALAAAAPNDPPPELKSETPAAQVKAPLFEPVTKVDGKTLQVVFGSRAVFHLNEAGDPVLDKADKGQLAIAHPTGAVKETFGKPEAGQLAVALDGSAQKKTSYLKVWNGLDYPVAYRAGVLVLVRGKLQPSTVKVCAVPAGGTSYETWPRPVVAVAVGSFTRAKDEKACR